MSEFDADAISARLDPDMRSLLEVIPFGAVSLDNLELSRSTLIAPVDPASLSDAVERRTVLVPGPEGSPDVALRIHRPTVVNGSMGAMVWMHSGGLVLGNAVSDDLRFDHWCAKHQMIAVSVEYRLAPEHRYPAAIEDCYAGLAWVGANADELGVDLSRLGVGGQSAGAGLAAALALLARDRGGPSVSSQLLYYPMLDDRQITPSSRWEAPIWPPASNTFGWSAYLGDAHRGPDVAAYAAAARAVDLSGLPSALICVGALDGFVDENIHYAQRLNGAGVEVELHVYPGMPHAFESLLPDSPAGRSCSAAVSGWITKHYAR